MRRRLPALAGGAVFVNFWSSAAFHLGVDRRRRIPHLQFAIRPVSRIAPGAQVRLVDDNDLSVSRGEIGELVVRGPNVAIGYWAGPRQITDARKGGWYHTGDLMRQDGKGDLWFVSRKKHLIIRGGSNISPVEVERVLAAHPAVRDAAVVGVPDAVLGERVAGVVQLSECAQSVEPDEILDFARERIADYKVPETLEIVDQIPRNTLGKIDRLSVLTMILISNQIKS